MDNAISDAVTEFSFQRDGLQVAKNAEENSQRMGFFAHELRNLLGTATLAFAATEAGNLSLTGATGSILKRSLSSLDKLITATIEDVRMLEQDVVTLNSFSLADFITEIYDVATLSAKVYGCSLRILPVDSDLAVRGTQDLLIAAVANLLQNAFKFTQPGSEVLLTAYAQGDRILIDVKDHCGGLRVGATETIFLPFSQAGTNRTGMGLGLTIARRTVEANRGTLTVHNIEGIGCVFTINLPRHSMPTC